MHSSSSAVMEVQDIDVMRLTLDFARHAMDSLAKLSLPSSATVSKFADSSRLSGQRRTDQGAGNQQDRRH